MKAIPKTFVTWQFPLMFAVSYVVFCSLSLVRPLVRDVAPWLGTLGEMSAFFLWPYPFLLSVQRWWPRGEAGWLAADVLGLGLVVLAGWLFQRWWGPSRPKGWRLLGCGVCLWYAPSLLWQVGWWCLAAAVGWPTGE